VRNLLIMGCARAKRPEDGLMPAYERYDGSAWRVLRCWQRQTPYWQDLPTVWGLRGQHGLFSADIPIRAYDQQMTAAFADALRPAIARGLSLAEQPQRQVLVLLGAAYAAALPNLPWPADYATGAIGQRLAQLKHWLEGLR
jgi:hypothetical protein